METKIIDKVKNLIAQGKTKEVFDLLKNNLNSQSELVIIEAEYNELRSAELKNILTPHDIQLKKNQINNRLLELIESTPSISNTSSKKNLWKIILPIGLVLGTVGIWILTSDSENCPTFPPNYNNKILVIPFENVGDQQRSAKPQTTLKNKINQLTKKNNLSSIAELGESLEDMSMNKANSMANNCDADLLIWGEYSSRSDSIYIIMNYFFAHQPDWNLSNELIALKDVTAIQSGEMSKSLDDAILSLCGIIAIRENNNIIAKKWFDKVKGKEGLDDQFLQVLNQ